MAADEKDVGEPVAGELTAAPLAAVRAYWQDFDLEGLRSTLDAQGLQIASLQEESTVNRRRLAEATREFKRSAGEEVVRAAAPLLKSYQEEIDRLSKRAKHSENSFLELYPKLFEAPDPAPALAAAFETASRVSELEAQCGKLAQELAEYKKEAAHIRNQELTVRRLEEKVRVLEGELETRAAEVAAARDAAVAQADAAALQSMQERESQLTAMLAEAQSSLAALQRLHAASQNQLFALQSASEEQAAGAQGELEMATAELERAQERMAAMELEKRRLVEQLAAKREGGGAAGPEAPQRGSSGGASGAAAGAPPPAGIEESLRAEVAAQREVAVRLRVEVSSLKREKEEAESMWALRQEGLRSALAGAEERAAALAAALDARPTASQVEDLKRQIRMLQAVGYNAAEDDDEAGGRPAEEAGSSAGGASASGAGSGTAGANGHGSASAGSGPSAASLERLLLGKNRRLEHELTVARLRCSELQAQLEAATTAATEAAEAASLRQAAVERLEAALLAAQGPKDAAGDGEGGSGDDGEADSSVVRVLCAQRDRLRSRAAELEEAVGSARAGLQAAKAEAAALRADNVALVERLRYINGYNAKAGAAPPPGDVEGGRGVEARYARLYEESVNPFKEFQGQQREKQRKALGVADRAVYALAQLIFGTPAARLFVFCYLVALHVLVFSSVFRMAHTSSEQLADHSAAVLAPENRHDATAALLQHGGAAAAGAAAAGR